MNVNLMRGDCRAILKTIPDNSVDSIVTDPPYGIGFMGKDWDHNVPSVDVWADCFRVLKPGGYLLAFASTRTQHRMAVNIEDAGFEIKDIIAWVYGSGWPKGQNIAKAIDKALGVEPRIIGKNPNAEGRKINKSRIAGTGGDYGNDDSPRVAYLTEPTSEEAKKWDGWNTTLKPALEPITLARKPHKGTIAKNILAHGVGALNIDACRVSYENDAPNPATNPLYRQNAGYACQSSPDTNSCNFSFKPNGGIKAAHELGRYPANLIHDGSNEVLSLFPSEAGAKAKVKGTESSRVNDVVYGARNRVEGVFHGDTGSAARFFYCAKATRKDRTNNGTVENKHVTVKPFELMRYLCRLVTPKGGVVLDPFMGSGSTGKAAVHDGFGFIGIEIDEDSFNTAAARIPCDEVRAC